MVAGAPRHRGDGPGDCLHGIEVDVAHDACFRAGDADVDDAGSGLHVCCSHHAGLASAGDDDVGLTADVDHVVG